MCVSSRIAPEDRIKGITRAPFGTTQGGQLAQLFTLTNKQGMRVKISDFGGVITAIEAPDKNGVFADVVLGFDQLAPYESQSPYFGALIGRFGNRIARGQFELDGKVISLPLNDGSNHLHGGDVGFDKVLWQAQTEGSGDDLLLRLNYLSPAGEQGYPGNLTVEVVYRLTDNNQLFTEFSAVTDAATPVNFTQHSYFNLGATSSVLNHRLQIFADRYTPIGEGLIPTGELASVVGTPLDFSAPKAIGVDIDKACEQLNLAGGYDHNFALTKSAPGAYERAAIAADAESGRVLTLYTTEPGLQFYSGNFLDGTLVGKGKTYERRGGFCLEPQHFPNSPNQPNFPETILRPGQTYCSKLCFEFSVT